MRGIVPSSLGSSRPGLPAGERVNTLGHPAVARSAAGLARPLASRSGPGAGGGSHAEVPCSASPAPVSIVQGFLPSLLVVSLAEIGDKTQLLALLLAARFRRPAPILLGIALATLANHALAGAIGAGIRAAVAPDALRWTLAASFLALALWVLRPDRRDGGTDSAPSRFGPFLVSLVLFFLAEIGDKTQIATVALGARYPDLAAVVLGTTLGMLAANLPPVLFGCAAAHRIPMRPVRHAAAALFAIMGVATHLGWLGL